MGSSPSSHNKGRGTPLNMNNNKEDRPGVDEAGGDEAEATNDPSLDSETRNKKGDGGGDEPAKEISIEEHKQNIAETVAFLMTVDEFATKECQEKFATLGKISMDRAKRLELGQYITELGIADLYVTVHKNLYSHDLFNVESTDESRKQAQVNLKKMRVAYWNFTDCTPELCEALGKSGALEVTIKELTHPGISYDKLKDASKRNVVQGALGILQNSIRLCDDNRDIYRKAGAVDILHTLMSCTFLIVRVQCLLTLSYIITEEESEKITASDGSIDTLLTWIREGLRTKNHKTKRFGFSVEELMYGLNNLALNDSNKVKVVQKGGLDPMAKMLSLAYSDKEQELAAGLVWKLAFIPSNRAVIQQNKPLIEVLTSLRTCDNPTLRESCTGALWETSEGHIDLPGHILHGTEASAVSSKHIMISYQWDVQQRMVKIKDELIDAGYRVWMDVDKMEGDILGAMAEAVENSAVVLVCLSQKYKDSHNTRTEATYAYKQSIPIVPLLVQENYQADGWLGALVGTLLYFKFYEEDQVEQNLPYLMQEIGERGKAVADGTITRQESQPTKALPPESKASAAAPAKVGRAVVATWGAPRVQEWLQNNQLDGTAKKLTDYDGELLVQMYKQSQRAPEFFHHALREDLGLDFLTILKLTNAMDKLMT